MGVHVCVHVCVCVRRKQIHWNLSNQNGALIFAPEFKEKWKG